VETGSRWPDTFKVRGNSHACMHLSHIYTHMGEHIHTCTCSILATWNSKVCRRARTPLAWPARSSRTKLRCMKRVFVKCNVYSCKMLVKASDQTPKVTRKIFRSIVLLPLLTQRTRYISLILYIYIFIYLIVFLLFSSFLLNMYLQKMDSKTFIFNFKYHYFFLYFWQ